MADYTGIPDELKAKLLKWEQNTPANKQVQLLSDIADISQEMLSTLDDQKKGSDDATKQFGAILVDMREQLTSLNAKEAPEAPDTSKPVIDAIFKLEKALTAQKAPVVNVPKADAPVVNVDAPVVTVDNKELSQILKTDLPKAFKVAINAIPKTESTSKLLKELSDKLGSIDVGVRLQPQAPTKIAVTNLDGTSISATPTTIYNGKKTVTTAGSRVTLSTTQAVKSVTIKALYSNTGSIYVGNATVSSANGLELLAGDSVNFDISDIANIYLDSSVNAEGVTFLAVA
jgi:hypothetical protein